MSIFHVRRTLAVNNLIVRMTSSKAYEDAIIKLNALQSNKAALDQIRKDIKDGKKDCTNITDMKNYLSRTGVQLSMLDKLSVIHVAGTKGKGSTSAMCESILRHHGFRTGFYSSPHLVAVRERIRLEGSVISQARFAQHFHEIYDMLDKTKAHEVDMPKYFAFLTVLAYNIFLKEKVDVAIVEVGIGGVVDYTNVLRKVPVVGITALGLDHTSILGNTLTEIAEAKAGIMKPGCEAYTVRQPPEAMVVLQRVANRTQCPLKIVPEYKEYNFPKEYNQLPVDLEAYKINASLAIQLAHAWIRIESIRLRNRKVLKKCDVNGKIPLNSYIEMDTRLNIEDKYCNGMSQDSLIKLLPVETALGLQESRWPGRYQVFDSEYARFYLDGAHTKESMEICADWFNRSSRHPHKILLFSATGDRDVEILLRPLKDFIFKEVFFVIPTAHKGTDLNNDNYAREQSNLLEKCRNHMSIWMRLRNNSYNCNVSVLECVADAIHKIRFCGSTVHETSVLVTGSLYLVGATLSILDENLSNN